MNDEEKVQQVADILTGKVHLCKECNTYHETGWTIYVNGLRMENVCPNQIFNKTHYSYVMENLTGTE